jgi:transcriptional activator of cad operon
MGVDIIGSCMEHPTMLRIGDWCVDPASGQISRNGETARVEERTMRLLLCLANHAGQVVSIDDLLSQVWSEVSVSPDSVYQAVASLRRLLGDDPKQPRYIATAPRLGYRMVANVSPWTVNPENTEGPKRADQSDTSGETITAPRFGIRRRPRFTGNAFRWIGGATLFVILLALTVILVEHGNTANSNPTVPPLPQRPVESIAVLPFLDLTEGMNEEPFADGMTEELIDKLSKIPGLRVPAPTSSFYFKGKQIPVADIARSLGVAYVLDGSVRKSGARLRVAARLIRADNGYIVWTETYDRPIHDILMVQDDIAGEVTKALSASIAKTGSPK